MGSRPMCNRSQDTKTKETVTTAKKKKNTIHWQDRWVENTGDYKYFTTK